MPWFRVDDTFAFHGKVIGVGNAALGLWVRAGSWSAQTLTGGMIPDDVVRALGGTRTALALCSCGLWTKVDGGYQFHDWDKYQPSKEAVEAERESARDRQKRARERAKITRSHAVTNGVTHGSVTAGVMVPPSLPIPTHPKKEPRVREVSRFVEFWEAYPLKKAKVAAERNWDTLMRRGVDPQCVIDGAKAYAAEMLTKTDPKYKYPQGWLTDGRWEDEPEVDPPKVQQMYSPPPMPDDMPRSLFRAWNHAHFEAHQAGKPGPSDWHQLEEQAS